MSDKVLLILVDGMRPDSLELAGHPYIAEMKAKGSSALDARTVMPSVTLPCHMSLFHAVPPERHGIVENVYTAQVRPIAGLFEQLAAHGKSCGLFHNWAELRDLARPGALAHSCFISGSVYTYEATNQMLTDRAIEYMNEESPDFVFLYLGLVDEIGHRHGWMSEAYIQSVYDSWVCIERAARAIPEDYAVIVMADHGGHDRTHGTDMPEDMTIPIVMKGGSFSPGQRIEGASIIDVAPTIAKLLGVPGNKDWEGKCLV
ncbi:alkaline phosphatase family protein [Paenibacillus arenilitoris]|uniref:Alkaline phosphatase family protein n=1 Tax=Paenibacillus arenilitoris TaxID=2772299 RepID=A0A927CTF1_9BACL|nr:alkaline phosphatase family protein [Paenibacillus arenilitoris]MBD2871911.1 alkaline phosphatase family protein [Paenibacillus arenilitoris]